MGKRMTQKCMKRTRMLNIVKKTEKFHDSLLKNLEQTKLRQKTSVKTKLLPKKLFCNKLLNNPHKKTVFSQKTKTMH